MNLQLGPFQWLLVSMLAALYVFMTYRLAAWAHRNGHNGIFWFILSLLLTAVPALLYFNVLAARAKLRFILGRDEPDAPPPDHQDDQAEPDGEEAPPPHRRCPHCRRLVVSRRDASGLDLCPACGLPMDRGDIA